MADRPSNDTISVTRWSKLNVETNRDVEEHIVTFLMNAFASTHCRTRISHTVKTCSFEKPKAVCSLGTSNFKYTKCDERLPTRETVLFSKHQPMRLKLTHSCMCWTDVHSLVSILCVSNLQRLFTLSKLYR